MAIVNGKKIEVQDTNNQSKQPSINEILDRMQNNYDTINVSSSNFSNTNKKQTENSNVTSTANAGDKDSLIMSILPMLLSKNNDKVSTSSFDSNKLLEILLKDNPDPMIKKLLELMPLLTKKSSPAQTESNKKSENTKISSFVKTDDYKE